MTCHVTSSQEGNLKGLIRAQWTFLEIIVRSLFKMFGNVSSWNFRLIVSRLARLWFNFSDKKNDYNKFLLWPEQAWYWIRGLMTSKLVPENVRTYMITSVHIKNIFARNQQKENLEVHEGFWNLKSHRNGNQLKKSLSELFWLLFVAALFIFAAQQFNKMTGRDRSTKSFLCIDRFAKVFFSPFHNLMGALSNEWLPP